MQGDPKIVSVLNELLQSEFTSIFQYFTHSEMLANWGFHRMAARTKAEAIEEMKHAEHLIERILFLEGTPEVGSALKVKIGATVKDQLANDLKSETAGVAAYNKAAQLARDAGDNGSEELFECHLKDEEKHVNFLEEQLSLIEQMKLENYLLLIANGD